jgi:hypothetical protein
METVYKSVLIPCYRKSDGTNGFYDTVNDNRISDLERHDDGR